MLLLSVSIETSMWVLIDEVDEIHPSPQLHEVQRSSRHLHCQVSFPSGLEFWPKLIAILLQLQDMYVCT